MNLSRKVKFGLKYLTGHKIQGVGINLTRRCDLNCSYCQIKDNSSKEKELSNIEWKKIINKFIKNKHAHFIFTGGEPLLYEGVFDLIDYTSKSALTSLITNTNQLNKNNAHKLKNLDFLTFSWDTTTKDNTFKKNSLSKLKLIERTSKRYNIKPSTIITILLKM
ncbi:MAG: radical SAM protein [Candidatus Woesearchaeota archaeon]